MPGHHCRDPAFEEGEVPKALDDDVQEAVVLPCVCARMCANVSMRARLDTDASSFCGRKGARVMYLVAVAPRGP